MIEIADAASDAEMGTEFVSDEGQIGAVVFIVDGMDAAIARFSAVEDIDRSELSGFGDGDVEFSIAIEIARVERHAELAVWRMTVESVIELRPIGHVAEGIEREIFSTEDDVEAAGAIHAVWRIAWGAEDEVVDAIAIEIDDDGIHEARAGIGAVAADNSALFEHEAAGVARRRARIGCLRQGVASST